jgi:CHASE2 domain-containing sensor protein
MINYRLNSPAQKLTLNQVLNESIDPSLIRDRLILIGYSREVGQDEFSTPLGKEAGVWIHAQMTSQLLSAVEDQRPLIWVLPLWGEALWITFWSMVGAILTWLSQSRSGIFLLLSINTAIALLYFSCLLLLSQGGWLPFIPALAALITTSMLIHLSFAKKPL